jgi:glycosyltransferase involved in cell wall biosynthesis
MYLVDKLLELDRDNEYVAIHKDPKYWGRYAKYSNVKELLINIKSKLIYDQFLVPWVSHREKVDLIFNTKFSVPLLSGIDSITINRGSEYWVFPEYYNKLELLHVHLFMPLYCRKAAKVITLSDILKNDLHKYLGVPLHKMVTIYSAAHERFQRVTDDQLLDAVRKKYRIPETRFILSVTRPYPGKNIHGILQSFIRCAKRLNDPIALVLIGTNVKETLLSTGYERAFLEENNFVFPGTIAQDDLPAIYSLASLLIFPSYYESFGLPLVEAMRCGCPVVTSNTGACPEIVAYGALTAAPNDIERLQDAMYQILSDKETAEALRARGLRRAQDFSWSQSAAALKTLFENYKHV